MKLRIWDKIKKEHIYICGFVESNNEIRIWWNDEEDRIFNKSLGTISYALEESIEDVDDNDLVIYENDIITIIYDGTFEYIRKIGYVYRDGSCFRVMLQGVAISLDDLRIVEKRKIGTIYNWEEDETHFRDETRFKNKGE